MNSDLCLAEARREKSFSVVIAPQRPSTHIQSGQCAINSCDIQLPVYIPYRSKRIRLTTLANTCVYVQNVDKSAKVRYCLVCKKYCTNICTLPTSVICQEYKL